MYSKKPISNLKSRLPIPIKAIVSDLDINSVTIENYAQKLVPSLVEQVEMFVPPSGSFETADLRRYLELVCSYRDKYVRHRSRLVPGGPNQNYF